jgi:hypothetical protein
MDACDFSVETDVEGIVQVLCDLDGDGIEGSTTDPDDLRLFAPALAGLNTLTYSGTDTIGQRVPGGEYQCRVIVSVGTIHHVGIDIETSYEGLRLFNVKSNLVRVPLPMYWDDSLVQSDAGGVPRTVTMPTCGISPERSPGTGVPLAEYGEPFSPYSETCPEGNARAWGNFSGSGKANSALMDTYSWVASAEAAALVELDPACFPSDIFDDSFEGDAGEE